MQRTLFHIFQNNPTGRELLLQSIDFCRKARLKLAVFHPTETTCTMRLESGETVAIELNDNYTQWPETARLHMAELLHDSNIEFEHFIPRHFSDNGQPELPGNWAVMTCPRSMSETSIPGLGHIHGKVRSIVRHAPFSVLIPAPCFKPWNRVAAFYGGAAFGIHVVRLALSVSDTARLPLTLYTHLAGLSGVDIEEELHKAGLLPRFAGEDNWTVFPDGTFESNLWEVPPDALVVVGAADHNVLENLIFGSRLEMIQQTLPNPILVVGPECRESI